MRVELFTTLGTTKGNLLSTQVSVRKSEVRADNIHQTHEAIYLDRFKIWDTSFTVERVCESVWRECVSVCPPSTQIQEAIFENALSMISDASVSV
jgi:hypothetical protein